MLLNKYSAPKIYFCTFANNKIRNSRLRLVRQAIAMSLYDEVYSFDETCFDSNFHNFHEKLIKKSPRGFGYWSWKPYIILKSFEKMKDGDVLHYADAGCHLNPRGSVRLQEYIQFALYSSTGITAFETKKPVDPLWNEGVKYYKWIESHWTKADLFEYFNCLDDSAITNSPQIEATTFFIKKNFDNIQMIKMWLRVITERPDLLCDDPSTLQNLNGFIEHRHDQSIFSLLCKKRGVNTISSFEYCHPAVASESDVIKADWDSLAAYPIHARRDIHRKPIIVRVYSRLCRLGKQLLFN